MVGQRWSPSYLWHVRPQWKMACDPGRMRSGGDGSCAFPSISQPRVGEEQLIPHKIPQDPCPRWCPGDWLHLQLPSPSLGVHIAGIEGLGHYYPPTPCSGARLRMSVHPLLPRHQFQCNYLQTGS